MDNRPKRPDCFSQQLPQETCQSLQKLEKLAEQICGRRSQASLPQHDYSVQIMLKAKLNLRGPLRAPVLRELHKAHLGVSSVQSTKFKKVLQHICTTQRLRRAMKYAKEPNTQENFVGGLKIALARHAIPLRKRLVAEGLE